MLPSRFVYWFFFLNGYALRILLDWIEPKENTAEE